MLPCNMIRSRQPGNLSLSANPPGVAFVLHCSPYALPLATPHLPELDTPDTTRHARAAATPLLSISSTRFPSHMGVSLRVHYSVCPFHLAPPVPKASASQSPSVSFHDKLPSFVFILLRTLLHESQR